MKIWEIPQSILGIFDSSLNKDILVECQGVWNRGVPLYLQRAFIATAHILIEKATYCKLGNSDNIMYACAYLFMNIYVQ